MSDDATDSPIKIGRLAGMSGLSERTLRYYEKLGIITPVRSDGGTRLYRASDVEIAQLAQRMRELDIPVATIRAIATRRRDFRTGDQSSATMIDMLEGLVDSLGARAAQTLALQDEMLRTLRVLRGCRGCKNAPTPKDCPDCPMEISPDQTSLGRMIWQDD